MQKCDTREATIEELWTRLSAFLCTVPKRYQPIAQRFEVEIERLIASSQKIAGITQPSEDELDACNCNDLFEQNPAVGAMLFERLAARFEEHDVALSTDVVRTAVRLMALIAESWRHDCFIWDEDDDCDFDIWERLWDGQEEKMLA
jgi:hypothetical protein